MSTAVMTNLTMETTISTPRKRNHEGDLVATSSEHAITTATTGSGSTKLSSRQASPILSDSGSELTELTATGLDSPAEAKMDLDGVENRAAPVPASSKKLKLTFAEKEVEKAVKQREKEEKAKQKDEEKTRKEEEKRQKNEEKRKKEEEKEAAKRIKDLEKAEKQKIRDVEKQEKEAERAKKEAEKLKKEKSQMRLGSFFGRPAPQSTPPTTPDKGPSGFSSRRSSIEAIDIDESIVKVTTDKPANPEYEKYIIPYFVHEHTELAPVNRFKDAHVSRLFQDIPSVHELGFEKPQMEPIGTRFGPPRKRMRVVEPVREVYERVLAENINTIDLTGEYNPLAYVPYKILRFREDVRPPYAGTYTKRIEPRIARKLSRRPLHRGRTDTNYDYDSEAEWEEPAADDEEILDDEMSESEDGGEEMQDFLDDEDDLGKRRLFAGEMEPLSSGLCFEGNDYDSCGHNLEEYRMDVLHDSTTFPIDPFSTMHWSDIGKATPAKAKAELGINSNAQVASGATSKSMPPPRVPLATINCANTLNTFVIGSATTALPDEKGQVPAKLRGRPPNPNKEIKMISPEFLDAFKAAINGSDLTKAGLIEILKKQFPKCSKDAIKDTLGAVAVRVGKKESEKKWALV